MLGLSTVSAGMVQDALLPQLAATVGTYWTVVNNRGSAQTQVRGISFLEIGERQAYNNHEAHMLPSVRVRRHRSEQGW